MMETLTAGTPAMVIPFQTEQEGNGRRMEQLGCGLLVNPSREAPATVTERWKFGRYTWRAWTRCRLTADELSRGLDNLLGNDDFTTRAEALQRKILQHHGAEIAVDRLERLLA